MDGQEEKHGTSIATDTSCKTVSGAVGSVSTDGADDFQSPAQLEIPEHAITASVVILAMGASFAMYEFVSLMFSHPDAANVLIPVIAIPVGQFLARWVMEKRRKGEK